MCYSTLGCKQDENLHIGIFICKDYFKEDTTFRNCIEYIMMTFTPKAFLLILASEGISNERKATTEYAR